MLNFRALGKMVYHVVSIFVEMLARTTWYILYRQRRLSINNDRMKIKVSIKNCIEENAMINYLFK